MPRVTAFILRFSVWIALLAGVGTLMAILTVRSLRTEHSQEKYSPPKDDPVVQQIEEFKRRFGTHTVLVVGLVFDREMGADDLSAIRRAETEIRALPEVVRVFGLVDARRMVWSLHRPYAVPAIGTDSVDGADLYRLRDLVTETPIYRRGLVSADWKMTGMVVELERQKGPGREAKEAQIAKDIAHRLRAASNRRFEVYMTGMPLLNQALQENAAYDVKLFGWLSVLFVGGLLLLFFRRWRPVVLSGVLAVISLLWTLAVLAATDTPMSASLAMVVPLVLVISVAFSVHYLTHFYERGIHPGGDDRFSRMMRVVFPPSILTGLTTAIGFLSLATSQLESIQETGFFLAVGVFFSMLASSILLPALLCMRWFRGREAIRGADFPVKLAHRLAVLVCRRSGTIVAVACGLTVVAAIGVANLRSDANPMRYFSADSALRRSNAIIDSLGGSLPLEIVIQRPISNLDGLVPAILQVEEGLRNHTEIGFVGSAVDFLHLAEGSRPPTAPPLYNLSSGRFPIETWTRLGDDHALSGYVVTDSTTLVVRIALRVVIRDSDQLGQLVSASRDILDKASFGEDAVITGSLPLLLRTQEHLVGSQIRSFALAFFIILLLVFSFVRSWRIGILAGAANLLPVVVIVGAMGWLSIPLDIASIMIASVALGIIVDDTIHFLYRYRVCLKSGITVAEAIERTYAVVGAPLVVTTIVFIGGFLILTPSTFQPTRTFGLLSAVTVGAAFVADLLLLPALLVVSANLDQTSSKHEPLLE